MRFLLKKFYILIIPIMFFASFFIQQNIFCFAENECISFVFENKTFNYTITNKKTYTPFFKSEKPNSTTEKLELLKTLKDKSFDDSVCLEYVFPKITEKIKQISKNIYKPVKNACLKISSNVNNPFLISNEVYGVQINFDKLYSLTINNLINNKFKIEIPVIKTTPTITRKDIKKDLYLRSSFSTNISNSNDNRKSNIKTAMKSIYGFKLSQNETFSFNKIVGERNEENGYRNAKIILDGEFVDGMGGGVCQVSSTLYNSAVLAGLKINNSSKHSEPVKYVPLGRDAMVNFGSSDLKFTNTTNGNVYIIANYTPTTITIKIYGEDKGNITYDIETETSNIIPHGDEILKEDTEQKYIDKVKYKDEFFYLKTARDGKTVKTYRITKQNGKEISRELLRTDKITPQSTVKVYGIDERKTTLN